MLSKSLIQLSADGWAVLPLLAVWPEATQSWTPQALWWGYWQPPKGLRHESPSTVAVSAPVTIENQVDPHLHQRPSNIHRQVWLSLPWVHCSFPLGTGMDKVLFAPFKSLWKRSVSFLIPKKGNAKECSNHHIISHASKVILKSFKLGFSSKWTSGLRNRI